MEFNTELNKVGAQGNTLNHNYQSCRCTIHDKCAESLLLRTSSMTVQFSDFFTFLPLFRNILIRERIEIVHCHQASLHYPNVCFTQTL